METYLMITDITGKQYPHKLDSNGILIENFLVKEDNYNIDSIQDVLETCKTIRINNRVFKTEHLIEISIHQIPTGAY
jgi:hypothetical protein